MFYKDNYLSPETKQYFSNSPEFIYALFQKMKILPNIGLLEIHALDSNGNKVTTFPVAINKTFIQKAVNNSNESNTTLNTTADTKSNILITPAKPFDIHSYMTIDGAYTFGNYSQKKILKEIQEQYPNVTKFSYSEITEKEFQSNYSINENKYSEATHLLQDFFNLKETGFLLDKNGQQYYYQIVHNADMTIGDTVIIDQLYLYTIDKTNHTNNLTENNINLNNITPLLKPIGYLKTKYTTIDILHKLAHNQNESANALSTIQSNYKSKNRPKESDPFLNKNKGLGYSMYFHMAKYLNNHNLEFRQSSMNSDSATQLWTGIQKHWEDNITVKPFLTHSLCFLSIGQDTILNFENNKPVINSLTKPFKK
jgi:hypothetical protein